MDKGGNNIYISPQRTQRSLRQDQKKENDMNHRGMQIKTDREEWLVCHG